MTTGAALTTGAELAPGGGAFLMLGGGALGGFLGVVVVSGSKIMVSTLLPLLGASVGYARWVVGLGGGRLGIGSEGTLALAGT